MRCNESEEPASGFNRNGESNFFRKSHFVERFLRILIFFVPISCCDHFFTKDPSPFLHASGQEEIIESAGVFDATKREVALENRVIETLPPGLTEEGKSGLIMAQSIPIVSTLRKDPSNLASTLIGGCVDTATGRYIERAVDLYEPVSGLGIERRYVSDIFDKAPPETKRFLDEGFTLFRGWHWNLSSMMVYSPDERLLKCTDSASGSEIVFDADQKEARLHPVYSKHSKCLLYCDGSSQDLRNTRVEIDENGDYKDSIWTLYEANGTRRLFPEGGEVYLKNDRLRKKSFYLRKELKREFQNGITWEFEHQDPTMMKRVTAFGRDGSTPIYRIDRKNIPGGRHHIFKSSKGTVEYILSSLPCNVCSRNTPPQFQPETGCYLKEVRLNGRTLVKYEYDRLPMGMIRYNIINQPSAYNDYTAPMLVKKVYPDGRYLRIEYYNTFRKTWIQNGHSKDTPAQANAGLVKALYAPSGKGGAEECLYEFEYDDDRVRVRDACGVITEHLFDSKRRLIEETVYRENNREDCAGKHIYEWGEDSEAGKIVSHCVFDAFGAALSYTRYHYDLCGNVSDTEEYGDITGSGGKLFLDADGLPVSDEVRCSHFEYDPQTHLLLEQSDSDGMRTVWTYYEGSSQIASKRTLLNGKVLQRIFYEYDDFGNLCLEEQDNGQGKEREDLEGAGYRKILRTRCCNQAPLAGLIEEESEAIFDPETNKEFVVKTHRFVYDHLRRRTASTTWAQYLDHWLEKHFAYDDWGNVIKEEEVGGSECLREYDENNRVVLERSMGLTKRYVYNLMGCCIEEQIHADEGDVQLTTKNEYNAMGQLCRREHPCGRVERYFYDPLGHCCKKQWQYIREDGRVAQAHELEQYDIFGRLIQKKTATGLQYKYRYNIDGQQVFYGDSLGRKFRTVYTPHGAILEENDSCGHKVIYSYNDAGKIEKKNIYDLEKADWLASESYFYDKGRLSRKIDSNGLKQDYQYQISLGTVHITHSREGDDRKRRESFTYDGYGRCIHHKDEGEGSLIKCFYCYDHQGNRTLYKIVGGDSHTLYVEYCEYDSSGRLVRKHGNSNGCCFEELLKYNALGDMTFHHDLFGMNTKVVYQYQVENHLPFLCRSCEMHRSDGIKVSELYFGSQLLTRKVFSEKGKLASEVHFSYNAYGSPIHRKEMPVDTQKGTSTGSALMTSLYYDAKGQLSRRVEGVEGSKASTFSWAYDSQGRLLSWKSPGGQGLEYEYDRMGRLLTRRSSDGFLLDSHCYNRSGLLESAQSRIDSGQFTWILDEWKQKRSQQDQVDQATKDQATKDQATVERFVEPQTIFRQYTPEGAVIYEKQASEIEVRYERDLFNKAILLQMPGVFIQRDYKNQQLQSLEFQLSLFGEDSKQSGHFIIDKVDNAGRSLEQSLWMHPAEGSSPKKIVETRHHFDDLGRWIKKQYTGLLTEEVLSFNQQGLVESKQRLHLGDQHRLSYSYDALGQLVNVQSLRNKDKAHSSNYGYNSCLQRLRCNEKKYQRGALGELTEINSCASSEAFVNDQCGQIQIIKKNTHAWLYQYDSLNRLVAAAYFTNDSSDSLSSVVGGGYSLSQFALYRYDALGRRSARLSYEGQGLKLYYFIYDEQQEVGTALYDPDYGKESVLSQQCRDLVWHEYRVIAEREGSEAGQTLFVWDSTGCYATGHDMEGSIVMRIDPVSGKCVRSEFFDEFGRNIGQGVGEHSLENAQKIQDSGGNSRVFLSSWGYKGKRLDPVSSLVSFGKRDYHSDLGQWLTRDPLGEVEGSNLFQYLHNSPLQKNDAWGLQSYDEFGSFSTTFPLKSIAQGQSYQKYYSECMEQLLNGVDLGKMKKERASFHLALSNEGSDEDWQYRRTVVYINGICNQKHEVVALADDIARTKGVHVLCIYNPSNGFAKDAERVLRRMLHRKIGKDQLLNKLSENAAEAISMWNYGQPTIFFSHSEGEFQTKTVRRNLQRDQYCGVMHYALGGIDPDRSSSPDSGRIQNKGDWLSQPLRGRSFLRPFAVTRSHSIGRGSYYYRKMGELIEHEMGDRFSF